MSKKGRPEILDESKRKTVLAIISLGCSRRTAAGYVNCTARTIYNTAQRDPEFADRLSHAENAAEVTLLSRVTKASRDPRYWRSAAWTLERMFPDRFGVRTPETVTPKQLTQLLDGLMSMLVEEVPVAEYRKKILARFALFFDDGVPKLPFIQKQCGNKSPQKTL